MKEHLLTIDPQNDFCDTKGALYVPGANEDMDRLAKFIATKKNSLDDIHVTLDSHQQIHIAHPVCWVNSKGEHPNPFTVISKDEVTNGVWRAAIPELQGKFLDYVTSLETNQRYILCIWPPHCLVGSWGYGVYPAVFDKLSEWELRFKKVDFVTKGNNPFTEHYSAVQADVEDPDDITTKLNIGLIDILAKADVIYTAGEALSHCQASTIRDIANNFGAENVKKFVLLEDASSNVPGFEQLGIDFVKDMVNIGMRVAKTTDF